MNQKQLETMLDRFGADLNNWPFDADAARALLMSSPEARRSYDAVRRVEAWLGDSKPEISPAQVARVVNLSLRRINSTPPRAHWLDELRFLFVAPAPRMAFAVIAMAAGFGIGSFVGNPDSVAQTDPRDQAPFVTASADNDLF